MCVPVGWGYVSPGFLPVCRLTGISYGFIQLYAVKNGVFPPFRKTYMACRKKHKAYILK